MPCACESVPSAVVASVASMSPSYCAPLGGTWASPAPLASPVCAGGCSPLPGPCCELLASPVIAPAFASPCGAAASSCSSVLDSSESSETPEALMPSSEEMTLAEPPATVTVAPSRPS